MPRGGQLARQWRLLQLIDRPAGVTVADAAAELDCVVRTIWRDLRVLQDAGFPIYDDRAPNGQQGLWRVSEEFKQKLPLKLSLAELAALVLSRDALQVIDRMRDTVGVRAFGAKLQLPVTEHLPAVQDALVEHRGLRIRYYSFQRDEETKREVD